MVLTESNHKGNNEDGQTYCNTTSYQDHLLDGGNGKGNRESEVSDNDSVDVIENEQRQKERKNERNFAVFEYKWEE